MTPRIQNFHNLPPNSHDGSSKTIDKSDWDRLTAGNQLARFTKQLCREVRAGRFVILRFANINGLLRLALTICQSTLTLAVDRLKWLAR